MFYLWERRNFRVPIDGEVFWVEMINGVITHSATYLSYLFNDNSQ
jgi:hypothetical protein